MLGLDLIGRAEPSHHFSSVDFFTFVAFNPGNSQRWGGRIALEVRVRMDLGRRIRTTRLRLGMTGSALAARAGVCASYISLIEQGDKVPSEAKAVAIARALGEPEGLYRIWAATARLSPEALGEVQRHYGALASSGDPDGAASGLTTLPPELPRPPGRPPLEAPRGFVPGRSLQDELRAPLLRVPLLAPGPVSDDSPPPERTIESIIAIDGRLVERESNAGLVAVRLNSDNTRFVGSLFRSLDYVVIDRESRRLDPANVYAWRLEDGLTFSRAVFVGGGAMLLPTGEGQAPVTIDAATPDSLRRLLFGTVIWLSRRWTAG